VIASRIVGVALLVVSLVGCNRGRASDRAGRGDSKAAQADGGGADGPDGAIAIAIDAGGSPPDDSAIPAPSEELVNRAKHLLEAIVQDDSSLATDIAFPRSAWLATRDAADPGKDWERQVADPFRRGVHTLSRRRPHLDRAQVVSLEIGHVLVQATPRKHGWTKPMWTASGSRLTFVVDGRTRTLPIREMVAWRGAWYVTRLR
jgi:hypothetical protein